MGMRKALIGQIAGKSGLTDSLFIATKVRARGREAGIAQIEQSLGRLHRGKIDLIQVHNLVDVDAQMRCTAGIEKQRKDPVYRNYLLRAAGLCRNREKHEIAAP
jgi:aryl-alcohol dehydrogenase-like predicted oxidoreductase